MIKLLSQTMSLFDARFYDLYIHPVPDTPYSITEIASIAKRYGYSGIAIINSRSNNLVSVNKPENFSIHSGIEILCKPSKLRDEIKKQKRKEDIIIIRGHDEEFIRASAETEGIDILMQPVKFNNVLAKAACDNSIALGFDMSAVISLRGEARVRELMIMRTNLRHARKYNLKMILTSGGTSHYDLRSPREMAALAGIFGMTAKEAMDAMSCIPMEILKRKRPDHIQEGIEII